METGISHCFFMVLPPADSTQIPRQPGSGADSLYNGA